MECQFAQPLPSVNFDGAGWYRSCSRAANRATGNTLSWHGRVGRGKARRNAPVSRMAPDWCGWWAHAPTMAHQVGAGQAAQQVDDAQGRPASMANKSNPATQTISTPQGGGALHGIGETFSPDLHTGTGNFTVPIALPPGRNGFQPQLSLIYSTGNGNGPYGLGWSLTIPGVSRKTSKGIPRYRNDPELTTGRGYIPPLGSRGSHPCDRNRWHHSLPTENGRTLRPD